MAQNTIQQTIAEKIGTSNETVRNRLIDHLVETEIEKRSNKMIQIFVEIEKMTKNLNKLRADVKTFNEDGSIATETWSKQRLDERRKATEILAKFQKAFDKALDGDYELINKLNASNPAANANADDSAD